MSLSERLRNENSDLWNRILNHSFILEMGSSTLPIAKFTYYISQDSWYLDGFLKTLAFAAAKSPTRDLTRLFAKIIIGTMEGEIIMQEKIRSLVKVEPKPVSQVNMDYVKHLLKVGAEGDFHEIVAAILPCSWTYQLISEKLRESPGSKHAIYNIWIGEYSSEEYQHIVDRIRRVIDEAEGKLGQELLENVRRHFRAASEFELKFWDMAYSI